MPQDAGRELLGSGVRVYEMSAKACLVTEFAAQGRRFTATLRRRNGAQNFVCSLEDGKYEIAAIAVPQEALPADFDFVAGADGAVNESFRKQQLIFYQ